MRKIRHKNIVRLYEFLESEQNYYLVLEYCNRGDLDDILKSSESGVFREETVARYLAQIQAGFKQLLDFKVIHRDLKLSNLFLHDDTLKIGDFGIAKIG